MDNKTPLPFYMAYPSAVPAPDNNEKLTEREYMRQLYPLEAKQYLAVIVGVLDQIDFKENYFYDEYPDQMTILRLTEGILRQIPIRNNISRETQKSLIQVLLLDELLRRKELNRKI